MPSKYPPLPTLADWRDPTSYAYTRDLTRDAWAWEFLRRSPAYRAAWDHVRQSAQASVDALRFGISTFEDPERTSLDAKILWRQDISSFVLPLRADGSHGADGATTFDLSRLRHRVAAQTSDAAAQHVLFLEQGRRLQIMVYGDDVFGRVRLFAQTPCHVDSVKRHASLLHRLTDFLAHDRLAPDLYPPEPRGRRLVVVLRVLDGWLAETAQRVIGSTVFNDDDRQGWRDCPCPLRDRVRLTLRRGRWLMDGGYRTLLS